MDLVATRAPGDDMNIQEQIEWLRAKCPYVKIERNRKDHTERCEECLTADTMEKLYAVYLALDAVKENQQMYEPIDSVDGWHDVEVALAAVKETP